MLAFATVAVAQALLSLRGCERLSYPARLNKLEIAKAALDTQ